MLFLLPATRLQGQARRGSATDLNFHKFQPKVAPERAATAAAQPGPAGMSKSAALQIAALEQEKESRAPAQEKIDSNLLYTIRMLRGEPAAPGVPYLYTGVELDEHNNLVVDIVAHVTDRLLQQLRFAGALVLNSNAASHSIRAIIPPEQMEDIAASPDVIFIWPKQEATTRRMLRQQVRALPGAARPAGLEKRVARVREQLAAAMLSPHQMSGSGQGSVTTEGDVTHRAADARGTFGINGAGLKIGVLSDGVSSLAQSQATGDLPPTCGTPPCVTVLPGQEGSGDEGTAIMEIVHDMVPGASLYFATAFNGIASFAQNIRDLRAAGCDIIIDDVAYFVETPFEDGQTAAVNSTTNGGLATQAVNDVVANGALYFSSAGNDGNLDAGLSSTYEGDFSGIASSPPLPAGKVHNFAGNPYDEMNFPGFFLTLFWSDPLGGSSNDYDLYVLDPTGATVVASSTNIQNGTQDPYEQIFSLSLDFQDRVVVFQKSGANDRFFHLDNIGGGFVAATTGATHGHSAASGAYTVAAAPAADAIAPGFPAGPFPDPFNSGSLVEPFTSDGLRHIFFNADSTAITPGNLSSTGGTVLNKPDVTGADGVSVSGAGGFPSPFFGTSAAAPSAAAVAALVKSAKPSLTPSQIKTTLISTAIDIMGPGFDRDSGNGIVMAYEAVKSLGVPGFANPELGTVTATENPGNGNGILEAGEGGKLVIQLKNTSGIKDATGITALLTTSTPGVIITQPNTTTYSDLAAGSGVGSNLSPLTFTLASDVPCGLVIDFALALTYAGAPPSSEGPNRIIHFNVQTGMVNFNNQLGSVPPAQPGVSTATGTQTDRVFRNGIPSTCDAVKAFPGTLSVGPMTFDSYTFTACRPACVNAVLSSARGADLFEVAYSGSFDPNNVATNYAGDSGGYINSQACGIHVDAGGSYTLVVDDTFGFGIGDSYNLQFPVCVINCNVNHLPVALARNVRAIADGGGTAAANIDAGSYDPDGDPLTITQSPAGPYAVGNTSVLLTVVDSKGATAQATALVTVAGPTTTTLVSSANPSSFPGVVPFTANVTPAFGSAQASGIMTFKDGSTVLGASTFFGGSATFTTNALAIGSHSITAVYSGDSLSLGSDSSPLTQTVTGDQESSADIGVSVTHSPNTPVVAIGGKLAVAVTVTNSDSTNPAQVALTLSSVTTPLEVDSVSAPGGASCNPPSGNTIQCNIPTLAANSNMVFTINVRPVRGAQRALTVVAAEASNTNDPNLANNTASDTIQVRFKPFHQ